MKIPLNEIKISERQRKDVGDIGDLADSLNQIGQIHNIGVNQDNVLIWGYRRFLAAKSLGWTEIEAVKREGLTYEQEQEIELEEDIKRKDRTWQEKCLAIAKLFRIKQRTARASGETWNIRLMATFTGFSKSTIADYIYTVSEALEKQPKDEALWTAANYTEAITVLRDRAFKESQAEMERRRAITKVLPAQFQQERVTAPTGVGSARSVQIVDTTPAKIGMTHVTLRQRAELYNQAHKHLGPPNTDLYYSNKNSREFIIGGWFVGGGNISDLYGSYQIEYLKRIETLFPDAVKTVHLFVGSLPPSPKYVRVGLPQGDYKPDIECDAHNLSSKLPFKADLIYADPPYSVEDSEHYQNSMVNRERVVQECALVLEPGGFLVWLDQALPIFSNNDLQLVGFISYIRSTGNRFRVVSLFRKPLCQTIPSPSLTASEFS
jgi:ParB-like nuclease domain